jgi:hypothetical protein
MTSIQAKFAVFYGKVDERPSSNWTLLPATPNVGGVGSRMFRAARDPVFADAGVARNVLSDKIASFSVLFPPRPENVATAPTCRFEPFQSG